jgi:cytochrome d ubiquinol oxidase subunit II
MEPSNLALFWAGVVAFAIIVYVILDGFDLGVGVLFGATREEARRVEMMSAIAPYWDGNETWLVVVGASLYAAFPVVYGVFLAAFYIPVLLLLFGLIFRGVAFEFRFRSTRMRDRCLHAGRLLGFPRQSSEGVWLNGGCSPSGRFPIERSPCNGARALACPKTAG